MTPETQQRSEWEIKGENWKPYLSIPMIVEEARGLVAGQTLHNYRAKGKGIQGGRKIGKRLCFPRAEVVRWLMWYCGEIPTYGEDAEV